MAQTKNATKISVIIPACGGAGSLTECIGAVRKSGGETTEIIVVDNASPDGTMEAVYALGCQVVGAEKGGGLAAARNRGAKEATGEILLFLDSDIVLADDALPAMERAFRDTGCDALVGHYEKPPKGTPPFTALLDSFVLWHHEQSATDGEIPWFWASIGAVRRELFEETGGFREDRRGAEDFDFGYDISSRGSKILRREDICGSHKRVHTLWSYLKEVFCRTADLTDLALRRKGGAPGTPYSNWRDRVNLPMAWLMFLTLLAGTFIKALWWLNIVSAGAALIYSFVINRGMFKFAGKGRIFFFGPFMFYCHVAAYLTAVIAILFGAARFVGRSFGGRRSHQ